MKKISRPSGGVPAVRRTPEQLDAALHLLCQGEGPIAIDTERAAMYRFDDRAYLIQLRREGVGSLIIDPTAHPEELLRWQDELLADVPWLLHAAHTDLPSLLALGWNPGKVLDTQIAAKLLGCQRLGLSLLLEEFLSISIPKDKGNADWSHRPLNNSLLAYATLDVEFLLQMHHIMVEELAELGRLEWYHQECEHDRLQATALRDPVWTNMKGARFLRPGTRAALVARELFDERTRIAKIADIPPERLLSSKVIMAIAPLRRSMAIRELTAEFDRPVRGPGADRINPHRHAVTLHSLRDAISRAHDFPTSSTRSSASTNAAEGGSGASDHQHRPDPKTWEDDHPTAWATLKILRESNQELGADLGVSTDTILVARQMKFVAWEFAQRIAQSPPDPSDVDSVEDILGQLLQRAGCRPWQVELVLNDATPYLMDEVVDGGASE